MHSLYEAICDGSFLRHAVAMPSLREYYNLKATCRAQLKEYTATKLTQKEIPFSEEEERLQFLTDYCCIEQWKTNGLSSDNYFVENAIAINNCKRRVW